MRIKIKHLARVEGHLGFIGYLLNSQIKKAKIEVEEGARLIEGILFGRHYSEAPIITARICGICPVIHNLTAIKAIESALKIRVRPEVISLRKLMLCGQIIQSHTFHLFFLSLPDFLNYQDDLSQIKKYPQQTEIALKIRDFGNKLIETIGGRAIHPLTTQIGGFKKYPTKKELKNLFYQAKEILPKAILLANFFGNLKYPSFNRPNNFVSLYHPKEYAFYEGKIRIQNLKSKIQNPELFYKQIQEQQDGVVKRTKYNEQIYMVGALARINNNSQRLNPEAKKLLKNYSTKLRFYPQTTNIFYNIFAQALEVVHFIEESQKLLNILIQARTDAENNADFRGKYQRQSAPLQWDQRQSVFSGLAACEAPRGTLYHYYEINSQGLIQKCNIITPTAQFLNNIEEDLKIWLPKVKKLSQKEREKRIKMLIRAYDPCITCATH